MSANTYKKIYVLLLLLWLSCISLAQEKEVLQTRRQQIEQEIATTGKLLLENRNSTKSQLKQFELLSTKASKLDELLNTLSIEQQVLQQSITVTKAKVEQQQQQLTALQTAYANAMVSVYKQKKGLNPMLFVLSATSFNKAVQRIQYLKIVNQHRQRQARQIKELIAQLTQQQQQLIVQQQEKTKLVAQQEKQREQLQVTTNKLEQTITQLKTKQGELIILLQAQKQEEQRLEAKIKQVIAKELEAIRIAKEAEQKRKAAALEREREKERLLSINAEKEMEKESALNSPNKLPNNQPISTNKGETVKSFEVEKESTKADLKLAASFSSNKGKLPWPVRQGIITANLGEYSFRELPGIKKDRDGIDIRTVENELVKAIFNGEVRSVTTIPGFNKVVIISHGEYFTVYGKLKDVLVQPGHSIQVGENIGQVDTKDGVAEVHLQLWKGQTRLNPKDWLQRK